MEGGGLERRGDGGKMRYVEDEGRGNRKRKRVGVYTECIVRGMGREVVESGRG